MDVTGNDNLYKVLFEQNPIPMWVIDRKTYRFLNVNKAAIRHYGYSYDEFLSMDALAIRPDEEKIRFLNISRTEDPISQYMGTWKHLKKDGTQIFVDISVSRIEFESIDSLLVLASDITEKVAAERRLQKSKKLFKALIESGNDGIVLLNERGEIVYLSPSCSKIGGYHTGELLGRKALDQIHPDDVLKAGEMLDKALNNPGVPLHSLHRIRHKEGHYLWAEGHITNLLGDEYVNRLVINFRDVSKEIDARHKLETALKRSKHAQEIAHVGHWEADFISFKSMWSDEAFRIYGYDPRSVEGSYELFLSSVHPEDLDMVKEVTSRSIQTLESFSFFHRIIRPNGEIRHLLATGEYERDASNKPVRLFGVALDVTELKEKEAMLQRANKELETIIYRLSHDLRGPIASALGVLQVAVKEIKDEGAINYFKMLAGLSEKQDYMLKHLVKVIQAREKKLQGQKVDCKVLVNEILETLRNFDAFDEISITVIDDLTDKVCTDRELLYSIIFNLVENAVKYRNAARQQAEIQISFKRDQNRKVVIQIADNGIGINETAKSKVFDMFYRGTYASSGSGLGLYLVKNAVEKLNGVIMLESEENIGTTFTVILDELK